MALKLNERYPGRFNSPTAQYPQGSFKNRTAPGAKDGSYLEQDWANDKLAFFSSLLSGASITPNGNVDTVGDSQYYDALKKIFLQINNNLSEIKDAGPAAVAQTLVNLGLGEGSLIPIGVPLPYPLATPPAGFLKCNGSSFSTAEYPKLALAYPSGVLPDLRGEFIRGWDDRRGIDNGRALLSTQAALAGTITGYSKSVIVTESVSGTPIMDFLVLNDVPFNDDPYTVVKTIIVTPGDTRPRNIAFNFIVRAA